MKPIKGFPSYFVSKDGNVYGPKRKLKPQTDGRGYLQVRLYYNGDGILYSVARLVAQAYLPNPDNLPEVHHRDENKINNHVSNLKWVTSQENIDYSHSKSVQAIDPKTGEVILEFKSAQEAGRKGFQRPNIIACLKGRLKTYKGYRWQYG